MGRDHSWCVCVSLPISIIDDEKKDKDSSSYRTYLFDFDYSLFEGLLMKVPTKKMVVSTFSGFPNKCRGKNRKIQLHDVSGQSGRN